MSTETEQVSFGGVVVRDGRDLLTITPRGRRRSLLALPKGRLNDGERPEEAAAREVFEETAVRVHVGPELGSVAYSFRRGDLRVDKRVHFFLCRHLEGDGEPDGVEVTQARWIPLSEAPRLLAYRGERLMAERALSRLAAAR